MTKTKIPPGARTTYHHGNLRETLIAAAVQLIEERGTEGLSVREVAKRAGVSPAAPFRHFETRTALLTAVAEQAVQRLLASMEEALTVAAHEPAAKKLLAIGHAYLRSAHDYPTHFRIINDRSLIDYEGSEILCRDSNAIRQHMQALLVEMNSAGSKSFDTAIAQLAARALVYGLARMASDGHFPEWSPTHRPTERAMTDTLDFFVSLLESN